MLIMFAIKISVFNYKNAKQKIFTVVQQIVGPHWTSINPCVHTQHQNTHIRVQFQSQMQSVKINGKKIIVGDIMLIWSMQFANIKLGLCNKYYWQAYILVHVTHLHMMQFYSCTVEETDNSLALFKHYSPIICSFWVITVCETNQYT